MREPLLAKAGDAPELGRAVRRPARARDCTAHVRRLPTESLERFGDDAFRLGPSLPLQHAFGGPPAKDGLTIDSFPEFEVEGLDESGALQICRRSINDLFGPVKYLDDAGRSAARWHWVGRVDDQPRLAQSPLESWERLRRPPSLSRRARRHPPPPQHRRTVPCQSLLPARTDPASAWKRRGCQSARRSRAASQSRRLHHVNEKQRTPNRCMTSNWWAFCAVGGRPNALPVPAKGTCASCADEAPCSVC